MQKEYYTTSELAVLFAVSKGTIVGLAKAKKIGHTMLGKQYRFTEKNIEDYKKKYSIPQKTAA